MPKSTTTSILYCCMSTILPSFYVYADDNIQFSFSQQINEQELQLGHYWMSEKLDGIRALWTGKELLTRKGNPIIAPDWFTQSLPNTPLEGELWAGRGKFSQVQQVVSKDTPLSDEWRTIKFMLFDIPNSPLSYQQRYYQLQQQVDQLQLQHTQLIQQSPIDSYDALIERLQATESQNGEGLMLRKFAPNTSSDIIKIKKYMDSEGTVIGYKPGKGKYQGMVGSLIVQIEDGKVLNIGSGLSDEDRANPPALGQVVTFRYNGYTSSGLPRFARFVRVRETP